MMPDDTTRRCNYRRYKKASFIQGGAWCCDKDDLVQTINRIITKSIKRPILLASSSTLCRLVSTIQQERSLYNAICPFVPIESIVMLTATAKIVSLIAIETMSLISALPSSSIINVDHPAHPRRVVTQ
jgi:hypothetical protein